MARAKRNGPTLRRCEREDVLPGAHQRTSEQGIPWGDIPLSLRVLSVNPVTGVRGPERGIDRAKPVLYPAEILQLVSRKTVPGYWRRMYAVAVYTGARSNELAALTAADVDFEHMKIHITKQVDRETGKLRPTKTRRARHIDIEPAPLSLLRVLAKECGDGALLRMPPEEDRAGLLRKHLEVAELKREALFADDEMRAPIKFHNLRDTCLTWMAVRGDEPLKIQWRGGHTTFATTTKYIEQAKRVGGGFGAPFPALPAALLEASKQSSNGPGIAGLAMGVEGHAAITPRQPPAHMPPIAMPVPFSIPVGVTRKAGIFPCVRLRNLLSGETQRKPRAASSSSEGSGAKTSPMSRRSDARLMYSSVMSNFVCRATA